MTVEELYEQIGGNYAEALGRMRSDKLVGRFIGKFLDDTSCQDLIDAWKAGDDEAAFNAAHTAKGVCANLSLSELATLTSDITEALRPGNDELRASTDVDALVAQLEVLYAKTYEGISAYAAQ